eukprot:266440-Pelagomonas_calceolata.AAC.1
MPYRSELVPEGFAEIVDLSCFVVFGIPVVCFGRAHLQSRLMAFLNKGDNLICQVFHHLFSREPAEVCEPGLLLGACVLDGGEVVEGNCVHGVQGFDHVG